MTMFVQLLVFTCACALGAADELPNYKSILDEIRKAHQTLEDNVLSMDGNVPLLNDYRRHYAEIVHVAYDEAVHEDSCLGHDYYDDYQRNINLSAPFAIANPQSVVDGANKVIMDIFNGIDKVVQLIDASAQSGNQDINKAIDEKIKTNVEEYESSQRIFLAAGIVATQLNNNHEEYLARSEDLSAHNFVVTGAQKLELMVNALTNLHKLLYGYYPKC